MNPTTETSDANMLPMQKLEPRPSHLGCIRKCLVPIVLSGEAQLWGFIWGHAGGGHGSTPFFLAAQVSHEHLTCGARDRSDRESPASCSLAPACSFHGCILSRVPGPSFLVPVARERSKLRRRAWLIKRRCRSHSHFRVILAISWQLDWLCLFWFAWIIRGSFCMLTCNFCAPLKSTPCLSYSAAGRRRTLKGDVGQLYMAVSPEPPGEKTATRRPKRRHAEKTYKLLSKVFGPPLGG